MFLTRATKRDRGRRDRVSIKSEWLLDAGREKLEVRLPPAPVFVLNQPTIGIGANGVVGTAGPNPPQQTVNSVNNGTMEADISLDWQSDDALGDGQGVVDNFSTIDTNRVITNGLPDGSYDIEVDVSQSNLLSYNNPNGDQTNVIPGTNATVGTGPAGTNTGPLTWNLFNNDNTPLTPLPNGTPIRLSGDLSISTSTTLGGGPTAFFFNAAGAGVTAWSGGQFGTDLTINYPDPNNGTLDVYYYPGFFAPGSNNSVTIHFGVNTTYTGGVVEAIGYTSTIGTAMEEGGPPNSDTESNILKYTFTESVS